MSEEKKKVIINKALAIKVLEVVDAGLSSGMGIPVPGKMCVEAAVNFAMGHEHAPQRCSRQKTGTRGQLRRSNLRGRGTRGRYLLEHREEQRHV